MSQNVPESVMIILKVKLTNMVRLKVRLTRLAYRHLYASVLGGVAG